jgi:hypothetical protein
MINKTKADIHTPAEILDNAYSLLKSDKPEFMRSVVLESLSALEAYVQDTIFPLLESKMDLLFVKWLKDKTKSDFDSRMDQAVPLALNIRVDKGESLWREYKEAREIRNKVAHHNHITTKAEAMKVVKTVEAWLSYLGSHGGVDLSLAKLKLHIEALLSEGRLPFNESKIVDIITTYYGDKLASTQMAREVNVKGYRADLVLDFGEYKTLFEIKMAKRHVEDSILQLETLRSNLIEPSKYRMVLVMLTESGVPRAYKDVTRINENTSVIFINI